MDDMKRSNGARTVVLAAGMLVALAGLGIGGAAPALAADRVVMAESFTGTW